MNVKKPDNFEMNLKIQLGAESITSARNCDPTDLFRLTYKF